MNNIRLSTPQLAEFVLSEARGQRSRTNIVVLQTGAAIASGTVLGKITASGKYAPYNNAASDGSEVAAGILYSRLPAKTGSTLAVGFVRDCEVNRFALIGLDAAGAADLALRGVLVRGRTGLISSETPAVDEPDPGGEDPGSSQQVTINGSPVTVNGQAITIG